MSTSPLSFDPLVVNNLLGSSFLDVGCGAGKWGYLLKKYRWTDGPVHVTGLDAFEPHITSLRNEKVYDELVHSSAIPLPFPDKSFDSAIAVEILEHLERPDGLRLISELQRVCRQSFVVSTPNFHWLREGKETRYGFSEYEAHRYNFLYPEFRTLGFTQVVGVGFQAPSFKLRRALSSLGYFFPRYSKYLLGFWFADGEPRVLELE